MGHHYKRDGKKYPSVTTIIGESVNSSGALSQWSANMVCQWIRENVGQEEIGIYRLTDNHLEEARFNFRKVSQKALDIGSQVHNAIEKYLQDNPFELTTPEAKNAFDAFISWAEQCQLRPIELEKTVYGNRWAGTLDMICYLEDIKTVVDFKTSKDFYWESMGPQIAAYRSVTDAKRCGILRLDKESGLPFYRDRSKHYETDLAIFNYMVEIYFLRHPKIRSQFEEIPF
jgi:hypothetical protein